MATRKAKAKAEKTVEPAEVQTAEVAEVETAEQPEIKEPLPVPNVIWRGEKEPPASVRMGLRTIKVPSADEQREGFYSADARALILGVKGYEYINGGKV